MGIDNVNVVNLALLVLRDPADGQLDRVTDAQDCLSECAREKAEQEQQNKN
jgi:hypothetical protein